MNDIYPLKDGFGLINEYDNNTTYFISLIFLDLQNHALKKLHTIEYHSSWIYIVVKQSDPTTFLLEDRNTRERTVRICKIVDSTIIIGDMIDIGFSPDCFYDRHIYGTKWRYDMDNYLLVRILYTFN